MRLLHLDAGSLPPTIRGMVILSEGRNPQSKNLSRPYRRNLSLASRRSLIQPIERFLHRSPRSQRARILKRRLRRDQANRQACSWRAWSSSRCSSSFARPFPASPQPRRSRRHPRCGKSSRPTATPATPTRRRLSWFDQIVPGYWLVRRDILTARKHLDFSTIGAKPAAAQKGALYEAVTMVQLGAMPLPQFLALHPDARMNPDDLDAIKAYLAPWSNRRARRTRHDPASPDRRRPPTSPPSPQSPAASPSIPPSRAGSSSAPPIAATTRPCASSSATRSPSTPRAPATSHPGPPAHASPRSPGSSRPALTASSIPATSFRSS